MALAPAWWHLRNRAGPQNLVPNAMLQAFNDASDSLHTQSDARQRGNFFATHGAGSLRGSGAGKVAEALATAAPYELGGIVETFHFVLYPVYLRGEGYLLAKQGTAAAAEFQKIIDHRGAVRSEPIGALAHLGLGRACVLSGDTGGAKSAYKDFLALWKDADPDIPILKEAKAEYSKLQ